MVCLHLVGVGVWLCQISQNFLALAVGILGFSVPWLFSGF